MGIRSKCRNIRGALALFVRHTSHIYKFQEMERLWLEEFHLLLRHVAGICWSFSHHLIKWTDYNILAEFGFLKTTRYLGLITEEVVLGSKSLLVGCRKAITKNWYKVDPPSLTHYAMDIVRVIYVTMGEMDHLRCKQWGCYHVWNWINLRTIWT